jgi:ParB family chromosome partitioning protein
MAKARTQASSEATPKAPRRARAAPAGAAPRRRKAAAAPGSVGLAANEVATGVPSAAVAATRAQVEAAGGAVLATYREPYGGHWVLLAALPLDRLAPTPYQRELSRSHADRLAEVIPKVGRFLDPVIAVAAGDRFISPNGMHRLAALATLGAQSAIALVLPEPEIAFRILALNTEKAHNLKDKALEVIRMVRALAAIDDRTEQDAAFELEHAALITLGVCYERAARFSGGAYAPIVSRTESFTATPLRDALPLREAHAARLLELDLAVTAAVAKLKAAGFTTGYLKPIVVARINPLRFQRDSEARPDFDRTIDRMLEGARSFDPSKIRAQDVAIAASAASAADD